MRTLLFLLLISTPAYALKPEEIIILTNSRLPASAELAEHYCKARGVPRENIISMNLSTEDMTRDEYDTKLHKPLRDKLEPRKATVKCILCMYGIPLRVGGKIPNDGEKAEVERLKPMLEDAKTKAASADANVAAAGRTETAKLESDIIILEQRESQAAVDSELMLLWWPPYPLARWITNVNHWQVSDANRKAKPPVLLTARLDGPTPAIVKRLMDDAVAVEAIGLSGKVYVDARGFKFDVNAAGENGGYGYGGYDESMRETAKLYEKTPLPVTLDDKPELFASKSAPDAALYCGWYSHAKYVDCCTFARGAVAWHLASSEATTLRNAESQVWCPKLLQAGVAATIGPVAEPYTVGFPKPAEFFGFLGTGEYTLAEAYGRSTHFASWMMVLVGDPLYNPFKKTKPLKAADLHASPKAGRTLFR